MVRNPFISRRPVEHPDQFFGRRNEAREIIQLIGAYVPQSISIVGERRIGKTSLLRYVSHPEGGRAAFANHLSRPVEKYLFVYVDLELLDLEYAHGLDPRILFFRHLLTRINQTMQRHLDDRPRMQQRLQEVYKTYRTTEELNILVTEGLDDYLRHLESLDFVTILLLDEADQGVQIQVGHFLRALLGNRDLAYVLTTQRPLQELDPERNLSPLYNLCTHIRLGLLSKEAATIMITDLAGAVDHQFSSDELTYILDRGGRYPSFLKIAARHTFDAATFDEQNLDARIYADVEADCRSLWDSMTNAERLVTYRIAAGQPLAPAMRETRHELAQRGIVLNTASRQLFSPLFTRYVRNQPEPVEEAMPESEPDGAGTPTFVFGSDYVIYDRQSVNLTPQQLRLLKALYENAGNVSTRSYLYQTAWDAEEYSEDKSATVNIAVQRLRSQLKQQLGDRILIESERGKGYRLILPE